MHVWHLLVHEGRAAAVAFFDQHLVFGTVEVVGYGSIAWYPRFLTFLCECLGVEQLAGGDVIHVKLPGGDPVRNLIYISLTVVLYG